MFLLINYILNVVAAALFTCVRTSSRTRMSKNQRHNDSSDSSVLEMEGIVKTGKKIFSCVTALYHAMLPIQGKLFTHLVFVFGITFFQLI